ncbi:MAG: DedA family protein [Phycisphaeraceae bacterium]|nr:DedA family protein [Phycisphaeraceae bacterium]
MRLFTELPQFLTEFVHAYGAWIYVLLFLIIFCETGLVVTPFLPGDSLLFAAGAIVAITQQPDEQAAGTVGLNVHLLVILLIIAGVIGDAVNYHIGKWIGPRAFTDRYRFLKKQHLERTHRFFEKHGGKAIILARFVPIVRTFAPFVAGIGTMTYRRFFAYNVIGAIVWVTSFVYAGYFFGNTPVVKENFTLVIGGIIVVSVMPIVYEWWNARRAAKRAAAQSVPAASPGPGGC